MATSTFTQLLNSKYTASSTPWACVYHYSKFSVTPPWVKPTPQSSPDTGSAVCLQSSFFNHGCSSPDPPLPVHQSSVQTTRCMRRDDRSGPISANICATGMKACKSAVERKKERKKEGGRTCNDGLIHSISTGEQSFTVTRVRWLMPLPRPLLRQQGLNKQARHRSLGYVTLAVISTGLAARRMPHSPLSPLSLPHPPSRNPPPLNI